MATLSTKKRHTLGGRPATKEPEATLQIDTLPKEILLEIFRHILLLPFHHSRVAQEIRLKVPATTHSAQTDMERLVEADPGLNSITQIRKRIQYANGCTNFQTQVMLVCRTFRHLGMIVLLENRLVELDLPGPLSILDAAKFSLCLWEVPGYLSRNSVQPILSISITGVVDARTGRARYLCEWRDIQFLARFIRKVCCFDPRYHGFVDVEIFRTDILGLCEVKSAAKCLFILPIYAFLNGSLGQITHLKYIPWAQAQPEYEEERLDLRSSARSDSLVRRRRFVFNRVLFDIHRFVRTNQFSSSTPIYKWDFRLADQIWQDRVRRLSNFVRYAHWESRETAYPKTHANWEALALNTLNEVHDQWGSLKGFMAAGNPTHHIRHFKTQRSLYFLTGMDYLFLSYLPQHAINGLTDKLILSPTKRTVQRSHRSPDSLADEALAALLKITAPPDIIAASPETERALALYCNCAIAEAYIRVSAALLGKAWCWLYRALKLLCPGSTREQRRWSRGFMRNVRLGVKNIKKRFERSTENRWEIDGATRGEWFRKAIVQDLMVKIGERGPGEGAGGIFEEAVKVNVKEWVARFGER